MDSSVDFQMHCALYEMNSNNGHHSLKLPRYFITINKDIVFDYPKDFDTTSVYGGNSYPRDAQKIASERLFVPAIFARETLNQRFPKNVT